MASATGLLLALGYGITSDFRLPSHQPAVPKSKASISPLLMAALSYMHYDLRTGCFPGQSRKTLMLGHDCYGRLSSHLPTLRILGAKHQNLILAN